MAITLFESSRDVLVLGTIDTVVAVPGPLLRLSGWRGGQWVRYVTPVDIDDFVVEASDGIEASGFLSDASENYDRGGPGSPNNFTSQQFRGDGVGAIPVMAGGGRVLFGVFETIALTGGGARAAGPITYSLNEALKVSENGLLCNDPDVNLLAATGGSSTVSVGTCSLVPEQRNNFRLGLELKF